MDIARYVSELLYEHECVILPGLGGFITNDRPATINRITHRFTPPSRKIIFNTHLIANDGLLINYLAGSEGYTYEEARQYIDEFTESCKQELEEGRRLTFKKIGVLFKNSEGYIVFEQDEEVNYNPDAFGLSSFYSPAIDRGSDEERIRRIVEPLLTGKIKPKDRKIKGQRTHARKKYHPGIAALVMFLVLLIVGGGFTLSENARSYWHNYTALIPLFSTESPALQPAHNPEPVELEVTTESNNNQPEHLTESLEVSLPAENSETVKDDLPVADDSSEKPVETVTNDHKLPEIKPIAGSYLIITGSFSKEKNAAKLVDKLRKQGINAMIADTSSNGMYRVAYASFANLKKAKEELYALRNEQYPDAWILKKK